MQASIFTILAAALLAVPCAHAADAAATLSLAEQPVRIIRAAQVYKAVSGTLVLKDDIVETGAGGAQLEFGPDSIVALGPQTRLYVADDKGAELALLQGWIKVLAKSAKRTQVASTGIQISAGAGAVIVHSQAGKDELFADEGEQLAMRIDDKGKIGAPVKVASESYAVADAGKPLLLFARPAKPFLGDMPRAFRDRLALAPQVGKPLKLAAVKEREADFGDVDAWLQSSLAVRKGFVNRFRPRLKDPQFRKLLEQALGQGSEWQAVLHPPAARPASPAQQTQPSQQSQF